MAAHLPPKPPAARRDKGPGESGHVSKDNAPHASKDVNTNEQGDQGNIHENTTNQGYQQDR